MRGLGLYALTSTVFLLSSGSTAHQPAEETPIGSKALRCLESKDHLIPRMPSVARLKEIVKPPITRWMLPVPTGSRPRVSVSKCQPIRSCTTPIIRLGAPLPASGTLTGIQSCAASSNLPNPNADTAATAAGLAFERPLRSKRPLSSVHARVRCLQAIDR